MTAFCLNTNFITPGFIIKMLQFWVCVQYINNVVTLIFTIFQTGVSEEFYLLDLKPQNNCFIQFPYKHRNNSGKNKTLCFLSSSAPAKFPHPGGRHSYMPTMLDLVADRLQLVRHKRDRLDFRKSGAWDLSFSLLFCAAFKGGLVGEPCVRTT